MNALLCYYRLPPEQVFFDWLNEPSLHKNLPLTQALMPPFMPEHGVFWAKDALMATVENAKTKLKAIKPFLKSFNKTLGCILRRAYRTFICLNSYQKRIFKPAAIKFEARRLE